MLEDQEAFTGKVTRDRDTVYEFGLFGVFFFFLFIGVTKKRRNSYFQSQQITYLFITLSKMLAYIFVKISSRLIRLINKANLC